MAVALTIIYQCVFILFLLFGQITALNKHEMVVDRVEIVHCNKEYMENNITVGKISRTDFAISWNILLKKDIDKLMYYAVQVYAFQSNEYRRTPLAFKRPFCSFLDVEYRWFAEDIHKSGNFNGKCPWPPGFYYVRNYIVDASKVPEMPWKAMLIESEMVLENGTLIVKYHVYVKNNQEDLKILDGLGLQNKTKK